MRIVKFKNDKFAVQKGFFFKQYLDKTWGTWESQFKYVCDNCMVDTLQEAKVLFNKYSLKDYEVIK